MIERLRLQFRAIFATLSLAIIMAGTGVASYPAYGLNQIEKTCNSLEIKAARGNNELTNSTVGIPSNTIDNNSNTFWSSDGRDSWMQIDLGEQKVVCFVDIAWLKGDRRINNFTISISNHNASNNSNVIWYNGNSSGKSISLERYYIDDVIARYINITTSGNQWNDWAGITEIKVHGQGLVPPYNTKYLLAILRAQVEDQERIVNIYQPHLKVYDISVSKPDDRNLWYTMQLPGQHGVSYFSLAEIEQNAERLKSLGVDFVEYDIEDSYSPPSDLEDPVTSVKKAYDTAHSNGLKLIVTTTVKLTEQHGPEFAQYADYYNIMAMAVQNDGCWTGFRNFIRNATAEIKAVNQDLPVSLEVSTVRGSFENMRECFAAGSEFVDGLNVWYSNDDEGLDELESFVKWFDGRYRTSANKTGTG